MPNGHDDFDFLDYCLDQYHPDRDYYDDGYHPNCPICNDDGIIHGHTGVTICVCPAGQAIKQEAAIGGGD